jgi:CrcB protein
MSGVAGWVGVGVLSALGALGRVTFGGEIQRRVSSGLPFGTLAVNMTGSLALGVLAGAGVSGWWLRLFGAALLGSYTTFSTWIYDTTVLAEEGAALGAVLNIVVSVLLGLAAVAAGWAIGGAL